MFSTVYTGFSCMKQSKQNFWLLQNSTSEKFEKKTFNIHLVPIYLVALIDLLQ